MLYFFKIIIFLISFIYLFMCSSGFLCAAGTPGAMNFKKLTRRKSSADALERAEPRSPTGYDWLFAV